ARRVRRADARGRLRPVRRRAVPARRRQGRDGRRAAQGLRPRPRAAVGLLRRAGQARRHRRDGPGGGCDRPRDRRAPLVRLLTVAEYSMAPTSDIEYKDAEQIGRMRAAGLVVASTLALLREAVASGVSTAELDALAEAHI